MAIIQTKIPYNAFVDTATGEPLAFGFLFYGLPDQDPEENPIAVQTRDIDGNLVDVEQPVSTNGGGVPIHQNIPVELVIDGDYSLRVLNKFRQIVFNSPNSRDSNADTLRASLNLSDVADTATAVENLGLTGALIAENNLDDLTDAAAARTNLGLDGALLASNNLSDLDDVAAARTTLGISDAVLGTVFVGKAIGGENVTSVAFDVFLPANGDFYMKADCNCYSEDRDSRGSPTITLSVNAGSIDSIVVDKQGDASAHLDNHYISPHLAATFENTAGSGQFNVTVDISTDVFTFRQVYLEVVATDI